MKKFLIASMAVGVLVISLSAHPAQAGLLGDIFNKFQSVKTNPRIPPNEPPEPPEPPAPPSPPVATTTPPVATTTPPTPTPINGLVAHWKFDDATGVDATGLGSTGALVNGPTVTTGQIGQALTFDGVDDRVDITSSNTASSQLRYILRGGAAAKSFTISAWINQKGCGTRGVIVGRTGFINGLTADCNSVGFSLYRPDNTLAALAGTITQNKWSFVTAIYDQPTGKMWLFVNGFHVGQADVGTSLRDNSPLIQIGGQQDIKWFFNGGIDDVRIYNRTLSDSEIKNLYYAYVPYPPQAPKVQIPTNPVQKMYTWDPMIKSNCSSTYVTPNVGSDCPNATTTRKWLWGTTNEYATFSGGTLNDFFPGDPAWTFAFHDKDASGGYQVTNIIDKVSVDKYRNMYSGGGFTDSVDWYYHGPPFGEDVHVTLQMKIMDVQQLDDGINGLAKLRAGVGSVAKWNGRDHYLEVNLWKTPNFDLCTGVCDQNGVYDRRFYYYTGEGVYFDGSKLAQVIGKSIPAPLVPGAAYQTFDIPLTQLYQAADWSDPPASWNDITLKGIYIGTEIWGKGKNHVEIAKYATYANVQSTSTTPTVPSAPGKPGKPGGGGGTGGGTSFIDGSSLVASVVSVVQSLPHPDLIKMSAWVRSLFGY